VLRWKPLLVCGVIFAASSAIFSATDHEMFLCMPPPFLSACFFSTRQQCWNACKVVVLSGAFFEPEPPTLRQIFPPLRERSTHPVATQSFEPMEPKPRSRLRPALCVQADPSFFPTTTNISRQIAFPDGTRPPPPCYNALRL